MGLRDAFQTVPVTIRKAFGDVPVEIDYAAFATAVYDPVAGSTVRSETVTSAVRAFFTDYSVRDTLSDTIQPNDRRVQIAAKDILGVTPTPNDRLTRLSTGEVFEVVAVRTDPAEALWDLQVRQP